MGTIDLETIGRLARVALAAGQPYLFGRLAPVLAEAAPGNSEWLIGYLRVLVELGLYDAARELIERFDDRFKQDPAVSSLVNAISTGAGGRIQWTSRRRRFEANVRALAQRDADAAEAVKRQWEEAHQRFELHQCNDGNVQVRDVSSVWPPRWVPALDDHRGLACGRVNTTQIGVLPPPLLFEGVGLGWEVLEGYRRTRRVFLEASSAVYVLEPSYDAVAIVFHLHDWRELLGDESVKWVVGGDVTERLRRLLDEDVRLPVTDRYCFSGGLTAPSGGGANAVMHSVGVDRQGRAEALRSAIAQRYAGHDASYWARRFADRMNENGGVTDQPLRILGVTSRHTTFLQYSMRDCLNALQGLGHQTRLLIEPDHHLPLDPITCLESQLEFEPDVVLLLSRMRYEMTSIIHEAIPAVTWDQDALPWVFDESRKPRLAWNDFLMGMAAVRMRQKFGWPAHRCRFCAMAGATDTYEPGLLSADDVASYGCDVSYVSHASATPQQEAVAVESWLPDEKLRHVFRRVIPKVLPGWLAGRAFPGPTMPAIVDTCLECSCSCSHEEIAKINQAVQRVGDRAFRHVALGWVADWADRTGRRFHLWGNGWNEHPRLGRYARGTTRNGDELRRVYQASTINLQLIGYGFLHQRVFDGLVASGFFLARRSDGDVLGPVYRELIGLFDKHGVTDAQELSALGDVATRRAIESMLSEVGLDHRVLDSAMVEILRFNAINEYAEDIVPHFDEITFSSPEEFAAKADRFLGDRETRVRYAAEMREALIDRYSYEARMGEMLGFVRDGFAIGAAAESQVVSSTPVAAG
ncbi:MAG: glycosyltransferase [Phycisphaerae bacterium]